MTRAVLKWTIPVDGETHEIGTGRVVLTAVREGEPAIISLWTDEPNDRVGMSRMVKVFGTGQPIPENWEHLGSVVMEPFVWHVFGEPVERPKSSHTVELASQPLERLYSAPAAVKAQLRGHRL